MTDLTDDYNLCFRFLKETYSSVANNLLILVMWSLSQLIRSSICSSPYFRLLGQCGGGGPVMLAIAMGREGVLDSSVVKESTVTA